jgi:hypothetical protein
MASPVEGVWLIMAEGVSYYNPADWGYEEVDNAKYYKYSPRHQEEIDEKYGKEIGLATRISRELLWPQPELNELGMDAPTLEDRKAVSDKILTCALWRYTERRYSFDRLFPCDKALFCGHCLRLKLHRVTEDFRDHIQMYLKGKRNTKLCMHHYVFHPAWCDEQKDMSCVRPAFEAIARFRDALSKQLADYARTPRRSEHSIGPAIWGIHCLRPVWSSGHEPIPHLHLAFVTRDNFRATDLNSIAERAASRAMGRNVSLAHNCELQFSRDKKSIDYGYFLDPLHRRKIGTKDKILALCSYVASPIKHDTPGIAIVINGLTINMLAGGRHYGILNRQGPTRKRNPENFYKPDIAAYVCKLAPTSAMSRWYKQP